MSIRVMVNGANGKMGRIACQAIEAQADFLLVARTGREDSLAQMIRETQAHIVIDLTRADCVYQNCLTIIQENAHPVIGTSGLVEDQIQHLAQLCHEKRLGGMIVPNFSIAACLMMHFAAQTSQFFPEVEIIEGHHPQKLDAPSGTALKTAEMIAKARRLPKQELQLREIIPGARGGLHHQVNIHSLRLPGLLARQQVIFGNVGETLSITHDTLDRTSFMPGIILACQRVQKLNQLYYGLEHLLFTQDV